MPYTAAQIRKFAAMEKRGEPVPADWRDYARGKKLGKGKKKKKKK